MNNCCLCKKEISSSDTTLQKKEKTFYISMISESTEICFSCHRKLYSDIVLPTGPKKQKEARLEFAEHLKTCQNPEIISFLTKLSIGKKIRQEKEKTTKLIYYLSYDDDKDYEEKEENEINKLTPYTDEKIYVNAHKTYSLRAEEYRKIGEYDKAINDITKAIELKPDIGEYYLSRTFIYLEMREFENARHDLKKVIDLNQKRLDYYYSILCSIYRSIENYEKAMQAITVAINLNPKNSYDFSCYYLIKSLLHERIGEFEYSIQDLNKAFDLESKTVDYEKNKQLIRENIDNEQIILKVLNEINKKIDTTQLIFLRIDISMFFRTMLENLEEKADDLSSCCICNNPVGYDPAYIAIRDGNIKHYININDDASDDFVTPGPHMIVNPGNNGKICNECRLKLGVLKYSDDSKTKFDIRNEFKTFIELSNNPEVIEFLNKIITGKKVKSKTIDIAGYTKYFICKEDDPAATAPVESIKENKKEPVPIIRKYARLDETKDPKDSPFQFYLNPDDNTYTVYGNREEGYKDYTDVIIPEKYNGLPVTVIGNWAFSEYWKLMNVYIPKSITHINHDAFFECRLEKIFIPENVIYIGGNAFANNRPSGFKIYIQSKTQTGSWDSEWYHSYFNQDVPCGGQRGHDKIWDCLNDPKSKDLFVLNSDGQYQFKDN